MIQHLNPRRALLLAPLAVLALAGCAGSDQPGRPSKVAGPELIGDIETETEAEPVADSHGSDGEFALWFDAHGGTDLMDEAGDYATQAGEALTEDADVDRAVRLSRRSADAWDEVRDVAADAPASDSDLGQAFIDTAETCADALRDGADALESFDSDLIDAATDGMDDCSAKLREVTDMMDV